MLVYTCQFTILAIRAIPIVLTMLPTRTIRAMLTEHTREGVSLTVSRACCLRNCAFGVCVEECAFGLCVEDSISDCAQFGRGAAVTRR